MKRDTKNTILAFAAGMTICLVLVGLELGGVDLAGADRKWFGLVLWTAFVFGILAYGYGWQLKRVGPMSVFVTALALHLSVMISYLRSVSDFPNLFFLLFGPLEVALAVAAMTLLTDVDFRRAGRKGARREKSSPPGRHKDAGAAGTRNGQE